MPNTITGWPMFDFYTIAARVHRATPDHLRKIAAILNIEVPDWRV